MKPLARSLCLGVFCLVAAAQAHAATPAPDAPAGAVVPLHERLASHPIAAGEPLLSSEALRTFYAGRGQRRAWSDDGRLSPQIDALTAAIRSVDREGLRPADYHLAAIDRLLGRLRAPRGKPDSRGARAIDDLDLLLSDAFFLYAADLTGGRVNPQSVEPEWNIAGRGRNLALLLASALERGHLAETLRNLPPDRMDYRLLREALAAQRDTAAAGGWPLVPWGRALHEGQRGARVAALRRRLVATGELRAGGDTADELFDAPLAAALREFQARHGLETDAVAGRRTIAALNFPALLRARQIEANLERLRWLPRDLGQRHLVVNIPDFRLVLTENGATTLSMRVIAGRQSRRTPFFSGEITSIVVNPFWTVPEKIAIEDKLPQILDNRDFLEEEGFKVFARSGKNWREVDPEKVDWTRLSEKHFPYRLRQEPGPRNALGRLKFQVPNRHDIYLHDTPSRGLFARADRAFSSGCIRVERPLDLAERLLAPGGFWTRAKIEEAIAAGDTVSIPLPRSMPVYLLYETVWVDPDGMLQFRDDVYGRDAALLEALALPRTPR